jgi:hypothetical protein
MPRVRGAGALGRSVGFGPHQPTNQPATVTARQQQGPCVQRELLETFKLPSPNISQCSHVDSRPGTDPRRARRRLDAHRRPAARLGVAFRGLGRVRRRRQARRRHRREGRRRAGPARHLRACRHQGQDHHLARLHPRDRRPLRRRLCRRVRVPAGQPGGLLPQPARPPRRAARRRRTRPPHRAAGADRGPAHRGQDDARAHADGLGHAPGRRAARRQHGPARGHAQPAGDAQRRRLCHRHRPGERGRLGQHPDERAQRRAGQAAARVQPGPGGGRGRPGLLQGPDWAAGGDGERPAERGRGGARIGRGGGHDGGEREEQDWAGPACAHCRRAVG